MDDLNDQWATRDRAVLLEAARQLAEHVPMLGAHEITARLRERGHDLHVADVLASLDALDGEYLDGRANRGDDELKSFVVTGLTSKGRREVGQWPREVPPVDQLVAAIATVLEQTTDPAQKTRLEKLKDMAGDLSTQTAANLLAVLAVGGIGSLGG